jgi:hypothetical protein
MSTELVQFSLTSVPDYLREEQSDLTKSLMENMGSSLKRISIRGRKFRCVVGGEEVARIDKDYMDVIIVNVAKDPARQYYPGAYDPKAEAAPPVCWSADSRVPHPSVEEPQGKSCAECPQNIAGSGQGTSKACRLSKRIAVVLLDDLNSGVYMLQMPATSVFGKGDAAHMPYDQYFKFISSQNQSIDRIVTRIRFDDDSDAPKLYFSAVAYPPKEALSLLVDYGKSQEAKMAITMSVAKKLDGPKQIPAPAEPTVRATKAEKGPTAKASLTDAINKFARPTDDE